MPGDFAHGKVRLIELADRTHGQLMELSRDIGADRCDQMLAALRDVSAHIERLRAGLLRSSPPETC